MEEPGRQIPPYEEEVNLLDYWRVIWKRKTLIIGLCFTSVLATLAFSLRSPKIYESTATILVPKEGGGGGLFGALAASGLVQQLPGISIPSLTPTRDVFISILKSRTMAQDVMEQFNLKERYRAQYLSDAISRLQGATNVSVSREGVISVMVEDTDPKLAADIANFYVTDLDRLLARFGTSEASRQRAFIAEQLTRAERDLRHAEEAMKRFQQRHKAINLDAQMKGEIGAIAELKGQIMASEVQLEVTRNFATETNPEVINLKKRIGEMKRQLAQMQYGKGWVLPSESKNPGEPRQEIHLPVVNVPAVGMEFARLTRDQKVQETLYTLLAQQLEQAKIAEARDMPTAQVLDRAAPAERKSKPKIRQNMMIAGAVSLFIGIFLAFFLEYVEGLKQRQRKA
ncbi:MAG: hypothetical protein HY347_10540 [candidate division NC10 bacterium]|nr:hypothetical protein [candidate division NC10 bacterium]